MSSPFLAEIRLFAGNFAPHGWASCDGQIMAISQNTALFSLLGTFYGGNGTQNFNLPNLQGRVTMGFNGSHPQGQSGGEASHALLISETPGHTHVPSANNALGTLPAAVGNYWAKDSNGNAVFGSTPNTNLNPAAIANAGGSQAHQNMMPYITLNFCIALQGIFPSRA